MIITDETPLKLKFLMKKITTEKIQMKTTRLELKSLMEIMTMEIPKETIHQELKYLVTELTLQEKHTI